MAIDSKSYWLPDTVLPNAHDGPKFQPMVPSAADPLASCPVRILFCTTVCGNRRRRNEITAGRRQVDENGDFSPVTSKVTVTGEVTTMLDASLLAADSSALRAALDQYWEPEPWRNWNRSIAAITPRVTATLADVLAGRDRSSRLMWRPPPPSVTATTKLSAPLKPPPGV